MNLDPPPVGQVSAPQQRHDGPNVARLRRLRIAILPDLSPADDAAPTVAESAPATERQDIDLLVRCLSHDLRPPISNSALLVQTVLDSAVLEPAVRASLQLACDAARRATHRLDALALLMRIPGAALHTTRIDASALCAELLEALAPEHDQDALVTHIDPDMCVSADLQLLSLALKALLDNACKFSRHAATPQIRVCARQTPGFDLLEVSDNGAGFMREHARSLFEPFQRIHLQSEFPGDGMGLAWVRRIAMRHGGWVWADLGTTGCTRFVLALPSAPVTGVTA